MLKYFRITKVPQPRRPIHPSGALAQRPSKRNMATTVRVRQHFKHPKLLSNQRVMWYQANITLAAKKRGCHLVTDEICRGEVATQISKLKMGMLNVFLQHTSASLSINENCDSDVRKDMEMMLNTLVPEDAPYLHTDEGSDDMPSHVKSSLLGVSLNIPVQNGKLALGMWQGIYLNEHRNRGGGRRVVLTLQGE